MDGIGYRCQVVYALPHVLREALLNVVSTVSHQQTPIDAVWHDDGFPKSHTPISRLTTHPSRYLSSANR